MAMVSPLVTAEIVEASEFMELANEYNVYGVPKIIANRGKAEFEGALPEPLFLDQLLRAFDKK